MFTKIVWLACIALEILLLVRAGQKKLAKRFPVFYSYISLVLLVDLFQFYIYEQQPGLYGPTYWSTEFLSVVVGYGVVLEIYRRSLMSHPGVARLSRAVLLALFFLTVAYVTADTLGNPLGSWIFAIAELGRDLRYVQAVLLIVIVWLFGRYQIQASSNLKGLIGGYGFFVGSGVIDIAIRSQRGNRFSVLMQSLHPLFYLVSLTIWSVALWSGQPEPRSEAGAKIERDYHALAAQTRALLGRAFSYLARSVRS